MAAPKKKPAAKAPAKRKTAAKTAAKPAAKASAAKKKTTAKPAAKPAAKVGKKPAAKPPAGRKSAPARPAAKAPAARKKALARPVAKPAAKRPIATKKPVAKPSSAPPVMIKRAKTDAPAPVVVKSGEDRRRESAQALALLIASAGLDKKAERIEIIDVCGKVDYTDFLVLMSGRSDRQVQAIAQGVEGVVAEKTGQRARGTEGARQGQWVIVDFDDVLVHVFLEEERRSRDLESLWLDARRVPFNNVTEAPAAAGA